MNVSVAAAILIFEAKTKRVLDLDCILTIGDCKREYLK
jgi:hypothetical protein